MSLSSIIVTWNAGPYIDDCLESLYLNGPVDHQVIVVDNGSKDDTVQQVEQYGQVELVKNDRNMGLGYATCQAERLAKHDLILVSNPDIIFTGLPSLLEYAGKHPEKECMMPALEGSEAGTYKQPVHWHRYPHYLSFSTGVALNRIFWDFLKKYCTQHTYERRQHIQKDDGSVYGASCMLFRRRLIERLGGVYRPNYFWAWADADMGMRLKKYGGTGCGVPEAMMRHHGGYSSQKLSSDAKVFLAANGQKTWEKDWGHSTRYFIAQFIDTVIVSAWKRSLPKSKLMMLKGWVS